MADEIKKLPKAIRISRKLPLSSEKLIVLSGGEATEPGGHKCTLLRTGCPAHTCQESAAHGAGQNAHTRDLPPNHHRLVRGWRAVCAVCAGQDRPIQT